MRVSISGPPGSGKTTVAELVAKGLEYDLILTGQLFREQANRDGVDVHEYNRLAESDPSIDRKLDEEIIRRVMENDNVVVEGRLAGHLIHRNGIDAFKVFVTAFPRIRAERIAGRERTSPETELKRIIERERSERERYCEYYDIDIEDMAVYDLVIDSGDISAQGAADIILDEIRKTRK